MSVLSCEKEEHVHNSDCYAASIELVCEQEEHDGHTHTDDCYDEGRNLICGLEESVGHIHTEECYKTEEILTCAKIEHVHNDDCYAVVTDESVSEIKYPEQTFEAEKDAFKVTVTAEEGALPENTSMEIKSVNNQRILDIAKQKVDNENTEAIAVDISFVDQDGTEIEPQKNIRVTIKTDAIAETNDVTIVHFDNENKPEIIKQTSNQELSEEERPEADEVVFDYDEFSTYALVYTVDFSYGEQNYTIAGNSSVYLSSLLNELNIRKNTAGDLLTVSDVNDVTFTDNSLITIEQNENDWKLISNKSFSTTETLSLKLGNGDILDILVTDDQETTSGVTVTGVKLKVNSQEYDLSTTSNIQIKETDSIEFTMNYTVESNTLSTETDSVVYQLPNNIKINPVTNKAIFNGTQQVGTYSISQDGLITFTYNSDYVSKNANGSAITADLTFEASVDSSNVEDGGTVSIGFSDTLSIDVTVEKSEVGDLSVRKNASKNSYDDGYIEYQIIVSSTAGTSKEVTLKDIITKSGLDIKSVSDFTISPELNTTPSKFDTSGFEIVIPQLDANTQYTITYRVNYDKTKVPLNGQSISNKVTGESEASKGSKLESSTEIETTVKPENVIDKSGIYNETDDTITWTVIVNQSKANLNGWTLKDELNYADYNVDVTISPAINNSSKITLPYTWNNDDFNTYTLTYTTSADQLVSKESVINKATLTKDGTNISKEVDLSGLWSEYKPLAKDALTIDPNDDYTEATINWKVTISSTRGPIVANWVYKDELWSGQWFTGAQLKQIKESIDNALRDSGLNLTYVMKANLLKETDNVGDEVEFEQIVDDAKYKVYTLYFSSDMPKGKTFTYTYSSIAPIEGITEKKQFRNNAYIESQGEKVYANDSIQYEPPEKPKIIKTRYNEANDVSVDIASLEDDIRWDLKVEIPSDYNGTTLTVKEHLPVGITLKDLEILAQGTHYTIFGATHFVNPKLGDNILNISAYVNINVEVKLTLTEREDGGLDATIILPENLVKHEEIDEVRFVVLCKATDTNDWDKNSDGYLYKTFGNTVELIDKDNQTISSDSHNQTITLKDGNKLVDKSVGTISDNIIPYSLKINEEGKDLVEGSNTITLTDILKYEHNIWYRVDATYMEGSIAVYRIENGEKGEKLSADEYSFTYEELIDEENLTNNNPTAIRTLKVNLPDSTPLIVEYSYLVSDPSESRRNRTISNKAYLEGYSENRYSDEKSTYVEVEKSSAHAAIEGIILQKVDADNFSIKLEGVKFSLYRYDQTSNSYVKNNDTYTTDENGQINFTKTDVEYETAYKLVEESTLEGYFSEKAPYYFIVTNQVLTEGQTPSYTAPDDFDGTVYSAGSSFYFKNRKIPEKGLSVKKVWKDYQGNEVTDTADMPEIKVRLLNGSSVIKTFVLNEDNGWTMLFDDLDPDGQYTVEEVTTLIGYQSPVIVYEQGDGETNSYIAGDSYGSATITNQPSGPTPETGSTSVSVNKKWVETDGTSELTSSEIQNLTATVQLVRYKAEQAGTTVHFVKNTNSSDVKEYESVTADFVVEKGTSVDLIIETSGWDPAIYMFNAIPDYLDEYNKGFYIVENNNTKQQLEIISDVNNIRTYKLSFSSENLDEVYFYTNNDNGNNIISVTTESEAGAGEYTLDKSYVGASVSLSSGNEWNAVFTGLPVKGTESGVTYLYKYAIKEVDSSDNFTLESYSTGTSDEVDSVAIPISNPGGSITVTNKKKEQYVLPATGGSGTSIYIFSGIALMSTAIILLYRKHSKWRRET